MSEVAHAQPLACHLCGTRFEPADVSEASLMATCRRCNKVIDLTARLRQAVALQLAAGGLRPVPAPVDRPRAQKPPGASVEERPGRLVVTVPSGSASRLELILNLFGFGAILPLLGGAALARGPLAWALLGAVYLVLVWLGLALGLNRLQFEVTPEALVIHQTPVPFPWRVVVPRRQLRQLFVEESPALDSRRQQVGLRCQLSAVAGPDRHREVLVSGLRDVVTAVWLEQTLERALRIKDEPVSGEFPR